MYILLISYSICIFTLTYTFTFTLALAALYTISTNISLPELGWGRLSEDFVNEVAIHADGVPLR